MSSPTHPPEHCATFKRVTSSMFQLKGKPVFQVSNSLGFAHPAVCENHGSLLRSGLAFGPDLCVRCKRQTKCEVRDFQSGALKGNTSAGFARGPFQEGESLPGETEKS